LLIDKKRSSNLATRLLDRISNQSWWSKMLNNRNILSHSSQVQNYSLSPLQHQSFIPGPIPPQRGWARTPLVNSAISQQQHENRLECSNICNWSEFKKPRPWTEERYSIRQRVVNGALQEDGTISHVSLYRNACKVHRYQSTQPAPKDKNSTSVRGSIDSFSMKSRSRLKFVAGNCFPLMVSQFLLTYGKENVPSDGVTAHAHLASFLNAIRKKYPGSTYMWILEFQKRGAPHFHVFFSFPVSQDKREWIADRWCSITGGDMSQFLFHHHPKNFIPWDMKKGGYLCKYLEKKDQKNVPDNFLNVGRFWGASLAMAPECERLWINEKESENNIDKGAVSTVRQITRRYEKELKKYGCKRRFRGSGKSYSLPSKSAVFQRLLNEEINQCGELNVQIETKN